MKGKFIACLLTGLLATEFHSQIFVPNGSVGNSGNSNVGIGTASPAFPLDVSNNNSRWTFNNGHASLTPSFNIINNNSESYRAVSILAGTLGSGLIFDDKGMLIIGAEPKANFNNGNLGSLQALAVFLPNGNMGTGTNTPQNKLDVNGKIHAREVRVDINNWPDYVFSKDYSLPDIGEIEQHINQNGHLPGLPSQQEVVQNGAELGDMNVRLLKKIEEMTLYIIQMDKRIKELEHNATPTNR